MKTVLEGHKIRFGAGGIVSKEVLEDVSGAEAYMEHRTERVFHSLGEAIHRDKPEILTITDQDGDKELKLSVYVFTRKELHELVRAIREEPGDLAISGNKL